MKQVFVVPAQAGTAGGGRGALPKAAPPSAGATLLVVTALLLSGCGKRPELKPASGQALPQKAATSPRQASVDDLLTTPAQTRPERIDDLLRKSQERREDHFDLPPAG